MQSIMVDGRVLSRKKFTGVERYTYEICNYLDKEANVKVYQPFLSNKFYSHIWVHSVLPIEAYLSGGQILFCPVMDAPVLLPRSIRLVVTIQDIAFVRYPEMYSVPFRSYYENVLPHVVSRADSIICISECERGYIEEKYPSSRGKTVVIYPGISEAFADVGMPREKIILAVASFNKHKNLTRLVNAFELVMNDIPHNLVLVGGSRSVVSSDSTIEVAIGRLERLGRARRTGYVSDSELIHLYQSAEIFAFPSLFEGFGFPPLEAMASGCAVCCSGVSTMPEICSTAADYFDPLSEVSIADSLRRIALRDDLRARLIEMGKLQAAKFTWSRAGAATLDALTSESSRR